MKIILRSFAIVVMGFLTFGKAQGQQMPIYGQYIFNSTVINPAHAGTSNYDSFGVLARYQWLGIKGAPITHSAFFNTRLPSNLGFSASIYNDIVGPITDITAQADLAYRARLSESFFLSFGVRAMASYLYFDMLGLQDIADPTDPNFSENFSSGQLNAGAGILAYNKTFFFGVSVPKILASTINNNASVTPPTSIYSVARSLIAYTGNTFTIFDRRHNDKLEFTPSVLLKITDRAPTQLDLNGIVTYRNTFSFGPMVRTSLSGDDKGFDAIGFLLGMQVNENWHLGYMYELPTNDLSLSTKQTHELSLRYSWGKVKERIGVARCFF
jgi:type IX secretion system PorP/SprF family membrane protein